MLYRKIFAVYYENRTKQEYMKLRLDSVAWSFCLMEQVECLVQWLSAINGYTTGFIIGDLINSRFLPAEISKKTVGLSGFESPAAFYKL